MVQLGSTSYIMYCSDRLVEDDRIWVGDYLVPNTYCIDGGTNTAGALTKWIRDVMFIDFAEDEKARGENAFSKMAKLAEEIPAGSEGLIVLPYFAGERTPINDANAKGVIFGLLLHHTRAHLYRAVLEGVAYSIAQHIDILEENGLEIAQFMCVGGGTKNKEWLQIIADVTGREIKTAEVTIGASYGDAMIAAVGTGHFQSYQELENYIEVDKIIKPNIKNYEKYLTNTNVYYIIRIARNTNVY